SQFAPVPPRRRSKPAERSRPARGDAPAPPARTPRDPSRRRRILDAARRHFTRFGVQRTSLDAVAADGGRAKGPPYLRVAGKTPLLREVLREVQHEFAARFAAEVAALPSPLARLRETLRFGYRAMASEPLFERLLREDPELTALRGTESADERAAAEA